MYSDTCVIAVKTVCNRKDVEGSGSGILIDRNKGHVLTHASVLLRILSCQTNLLEKHHPNKYGYNNLSSLQVRVYMQELPNGKTKSLKISKSGFTVLGSQNCSSNSAYNPVLEGRIESVFECYNFKQSINKLFPKESWKLTNEEVIDEKDLPVISPELSVRMLSHFVLIQILNWTPTDNRPTVYSVSPSNIGDPVFIEATPFGSLSPEIFLNSLSQGVLSNVHGRNSCLLLTDARCIPGCEGGALYIEKNKNRYLAGIIVVSLCWKNNEWVGLTIACSLADVLNSLAEFHTQTKDKAVANIRSNPGEISKWIYPMSAVSMIQDGGRWGSGVLIDSKTIISCAHVVSKDDSLPTTYKFKPKSCSKKANVIFKTSPSKVFDIALMEVSTEEKPIKVSLILPKEGDHVFVIGYGLFSDSKYLLPSITSGIISKVLFVDGIPVMIRTSCAVHAGASGGAVVNESGELIGIVVCNAKDKNTGASFPHVNMSIPVITVWPTVKQYLKTKDPSHLSALNLLNQKVTNLWTLNRRTISDSDMLSALKSKL